MSENIDMIDELHEKIHDREQWIEELERQLKFTRAGERVALKCCKELEEQLNNVTKQVRKEVLDELCNMLTDRAVLIETGGVAEFMFTTYDLQESIKQLQGEIK